MRFGRIEPHPAEQCARCGASLRTAVHGCSWFDTSICCHECLQDERTAPGFENAVVTESAAVMGGERNFPGVGLSDADRTHLAARLRARGLTPTWENNPT